MGDRPLLTTVPLQTQQLDKYALLSPEGDVGAADDLAEEGPRRVGVFKLGMLGLVGVGVFVSFAGAAGKFISSDSETADAATGPAALVENLDLNPAMVHFSQIAKMDIPKMPNTQGSNSYFLDAIVMSKVPGKEMAAGLYKLDAGPGLNYTYTYEEFKLVIDGEFHITDGTGQHLVAKKGDLLYFPRGTNVVFSTPSSALGYFVGQRISPESAVKVDASVRAAIASKPAIKLFPQIADNLDRIPLLKNVDGSKSYLMDVALSKVLGKEMAAGLYHELQGPTLHYLYTYEELKYIVGGEFHLTDGTGQKVVAKHGDLVYFPKGTKVNFETPDWALGFFCGQRKPCADAQGFCSA